MHIHSNIKKVLICQIVWLSSCLPTKEYFENDDKEEVAICLGDFNIQNIKHEVSAMAQL